MKNFDAEVRRAYQFLHTQLSRELGFVLIIAPIAESGPMSLSSNIAASMLPATLRELAGLIEEGKGQVFKP